MKKDQMQQIIDQQQAIIDQQAEQMRRLSNEIENLKTTNKHNIENTKRDLKNKFYEQWKSLNERFLKKYISELIVNEELSFSFDSDWSGHFTMNIHMDNAWLSGAGGHININRNGLEE